MSNPHSINSHPSHSRGQHSTRHRRQRLSVHQLTSLDLRIHEHLLTHRVLTTIQLVRLTQSPERTVRYRLERLHRAGHLGRTRPAADSGSAPAQWWLSTKGARAVNAGAPASATPKPLFLAHAVATADLYVALARVADPSGLRLASWLRDEWCWEEWRSNHGGRALCPDASAQLELEVDGVPGVVDAFIEIDLGTMTQARLRAKVTRFREYLGDNAWQTRHRHPPVLLVVTMSETRATTFLSGLRLGTRHLQWSNSEDASDDSATVAVCSQVRDPEAAVLSAVWRTSAEGRPCRLNELVATAVHRYRWSAARGLVEALAQVRLAPGAALEVSGRQIPNRCALVTAERLALAR
jgi:hypothetical protein